MKGGRIHRIAMFVLPFALLSGCAATHMEPPPPVAVPAQFKETGLWQRAAGGAPAVPDAWWQLFADPVLDDLQRQLVIGNENLRFAVAQVAAARAQLAASRATLAPTLGGNVSVTRSGGVSSSSELQRGASNNIAVSASASWEIDLWGRLAQATNAAQASYQASADDLAAARLSAQATLAQTYLALRTAESQQALIERSVVAFQRSLELTQARYQSGVAARSDVLQAQTQLKSAQAQDIEAATQRAQAEHAIAVLLGKPPSALAIARTDALPAAPAVPELLPATLLERRPDIAAAERRVAAAYAQIGIADAAFFPALTLSANAGYRATSFADVFSAPSLFWSLGPALAQALFDGGARRAASDQARANADQATSSYRQTVLVALQEVEDNLVLADRLRAEAALQQEALDSARRNLEITLEQYRAGTVSFLDVAVAQTAALSSERSLLDLRNRELAAINQLLKNIAGRWQSG
jgi:NodT family efflux transporter outer membrane factor (OMF) lipoprotein